MRCMKLCYYKQKMGSGTKPTDPMKFLQANTRRSPYLNAEGLGSFSPVNRKVHNFGVLALFFLRKDPYYQVTYFFHLIFMLP